MFTVFLAILPIFLLILTGRALKHFFIKTDVFWNNSDKLAFYLFFPALLIVKVSEADFSSPDIGNALATIMGATFIIAGFTFFLRSVTGMSNGLFTSVFQGSVRFNSYVFMGMAHSPYGDKGLILSSVYISYMILFTNTISVIIMSYYGASHKRDFRSIILAIFYNPMIFSGLIGLLFNFFHIPIQGVPRIFMKYLGDAATPLSLLSLGAGLQLNLRSKKINAIIYSVLIKLILAPIVVYFLLKTMKIKNLPFQLALLYATLPCAVSSYILARQMGGDYKSMAVIVTLTTLASALTIPALIATLN